MCLVVGGWGLAVFTYPTVWWCLVPVLATHLGGVLGAWTYYLAIELHWTKQDDLEVAEVDEEAEPLPVKKDLEHAGHTAGYTGAYHGNGSSAPPAPVIPQDILNFKSSVHDELRLKMTPK